MEYFIIIRQLLWLHPLRCPRCTRWIGPLSIGSSSGTNWLTLHDTWNMSLLVILYGWISYRQSVLDIYPIAWLLQWTIHRPGGSRTSAVDQGVITQHRNWSLSQLPLGAIYRKTKNSSMKTKSIQHSVAEEVPILVPAGGWLFDTTL